MEEGPAMDHTNIIPKVDDDLGRNFFKKQKKEVTPRLWDQES
jgi:hypothetical protein